MLVSKVHNALLMHSSSNNALHMYAFDEWFYFLLSIIIVILSIARIIIVITSWSIIFNVALRQ